MSNLDPEGKLRSFRSFRIRNDFDITIIVVVEHNPEVIQKYADKVLALNNGQAIAYEPPKKFIRSQKLFEENGLYASDDRKGGNLVSPAREEYPSPLTRWLRRVNA